MFWRLLAVFCTCQLVLCLEYKHDYRGFDDSILYEIDWPGKLNSPDEVSEFRPLN